MALNSELSRLFQHSCQQNKVNITVLQRWQSLSSGGAAKLKLNIPNICKDFEPDDPNLPSLPLQHHRTCYRTQMKAFKNGERGLKNQTFPSLIQCLLLNFADMLTCLSREGLQQESSDKSSLCVPIPTSSRDKWLSL